MSRKPPQGGASRGSKTDGEAPAGFDEEHPFDGQEDDESVV